MTPMLAISQRQKSTSSSNGQVRKAGLQEIAAAYRQHGQPPASRTLARASRRSSICARPGRRSSRWSRATAIASAIATWNGVDVANVTNWWTDRRAAFSAPGPIAYPIFQPVSENVLPVELMVSVRSHIPGSDRNREMLAVVEQDPVVDLIGDDDQVVRDGQARDRLEFGAVEHLAGRIVRGVEQDHPRPVGDCRRQIVDRTTSPARCSRTALITAAGHRDTRRVRVVERLEGDQLVARIEQRDDRIEDRLGRTGRDRHMSIGIELDPEALAPNRGAMAWRRAGTPCGCAYWFWSASIAALRGLLHEAGPGKSGNPWPRLTAPCTHREIAHLGEHGGPEGLDALCPNSMSCHVTFASVRAAPGAVGYASPSTPSSTGAPSRSAPGRIPRRRHERAPAWRDRRRHC